MSQIPLVLDEVEKRFGKTEVLKKTSLRLEQGTITGLLGRNGAGKTTMLKCCLGLLRPESGTARLFGEEAWDSADSIRARIGYVAQKFDQLGWLRVKTAIELVASFYPNWDDELVKECLDKSQIDWSKKVSDLSHGQKQLVAIAMAIGHRPKLLFLDEPVSGLDPVARQDFLRLLLKLNDEVKQTILFSTHIVTDVERVAADVAILSQGRVTYHGDLGTLKESVQCVYLDRKKATTSLIESKAVIASRKDGDRLQLWVQSSKILDENLDAQLTGSFESHSVGLEELFEGMTS